MGARDSFHHCTKRFFNFVCGSCYSARSDFLVSSRHDEITWYWFWTNGNHHRVAAKVVSKIERGRPATSVPGYVLAVFRARTCNCIISSWSTSGSVANLVMDRLMEIRDMIRDGCNGSRVDAMHAKRSITSTSTVRQGGLSTSTMGTCGRIGQNA